MITDVWNLGMTVRVRENTQTAIICKYCILRQYADMRIDVHRKNVMQGHSYFGCCLRMLKSKATCCPNVAQCTAIRGGKTKVAR